MSEAELQARLEKAAAAHQAAYNALREIEGRALRLQIATGHGGFGDLAEIARKACDASEQAYQP